MGVLSDEMFQKRMGGILSKVGYSNGFRKKGVKSKMKQSSRKNSSSTDNQKMPEDLQISKEFLAEELCQTMPKSKKGGPYPKQSQKTRREEVFKLHFEYGYSARKIAELMKINRNTINHDVWYWHTKLGTEFDHENYGAWLNKQLSRLESQRVGLRMELDSDITLQERLQVRKMIIDLDFKISNLIIKQEATKYALDDHIVNFINKWMQEMKYPERYMSPGGLVTLSPKKRKEIVKIIKNKSLN